MQLFKVEYNVSYPKVNYIGNKEKLAEWIINNFPVKSGKVLDLFSGGASVSFEAKKKDYIVYSNDVLYSSYVISKTLIENSSVLLDVSHIDLALETEVFLEEKNKFKWLENKLFYPEEIDELSKLVVYSSTLVGYEKYFFQSLIRRAIIRKLPYSRMNVDWENIKKLRDEDYSYEKYGRRRAYHNESFSTHMKKNLLDYNNAIFSNGFDNKSFQLDAIDMIDNISYVDVIYMDPPYPNTMNKYDSFYGAYDLIFDKKINHIDLTNKFTFLENIRKIIEKAVNKTNYIVLSINSNSVPGVDEITQLFSEYGDVNVLQRKHNYQVSGKNNKNSNNEILIVLDVR
ncbi:DNA adenine methylase [Enterococcus cecorum]|uniref:DNA adenine methylase n=1 Tax=Enterococcus cecorum TaxID=44008 RepID=UPI0032C4239A